MESSRVPKAPGVTAPGSRVVKFWASALGLIWGL